MISRRFRQLSEGETHSFSSPITKNICMKDLILGQSLVGLENEAQNNDPL